MPDNVPPISGFTIKPMLSLPRFTMSPDIPCIFAFPQEARLIGGLLYLYLTTILRFFKRPLMPLESLFNASSIFHKLDWDIIGSNWVETKVGKISHVGSCWKALTEQANMG